MNAVYTVSTNLNPDELTAVAVETYMQWLKFALGKGEIGGKVLAHPSGRYAASMSWKRTGEAEIAIIADESQAPEAGWIEEGRSGANMKDAMLSGGKTAPDGTRYRAIPIRPDSTAPTFDLQKVINNSRGGRLPGKTGTLWATPRAARDPDSKIVTMTDRPGSSAWQIPDMPAYSPAATLAALLRSKVGV